VTISRPSLATRDLAQVNPTAGERNSSVNLFVSFCMGRELMSHGGSELERVVNG